MIDHPFQNVLRAKRRLVEAFWGPQHPVLLVREELKSQQFPTVVGPMPPYCPVAISRDEKSIVFADIDGPHLIRTYPTPLQRSRDRKCIQTEVRPHEMVLPFEAIAPLTGYSFGEGSCAQSETGSTIMLKCASLVAVLSIGA